MHGPIALANPVSRHHPRNEGLVAWLMAVPGIDGGRQYFDLAGTAHGSISGGVTWAGTTRPGGYGQLTLDGTSAQVDLPAGALSKISAGPLTVACWINPTSISSYRTVFSGPGFQGATASLALFLNSTTDGYFYLGTAFGALSFSPAFTLNEWQYVEFTYDGATVVVRRNGVQCASSAASSTRDYSASVVSLGIAGAGGSRFAGAQDDLAVWSRANAADYDLARRGYPGALNRLDTAASPAPAASGPFPWYLDTSMSGGLRETWCNT